MRKNVYICDFKMGRSITFLPITFEFLNRFTESNQFFFLVGAFRTDLVGIRDSFLRFLQKLKIRGLKTIMLISHRDIVFRL